MKAQIQKTEQLKRYPLSIGDFVVSDLPYDDIHGVVKDITSRYGVLCIYVEYFINGQSKIRVYHDFESLICLY